jgi:hypothetical protein
VGWKNNLEEYKSQGLTQATKIERGCLGLRFICELKTTSEEIKLSVHTQAIDKEVIYDTALKSSVSLTDRTISLKLWTHITTSKAQVSIIVVCRCEYT